MKIFKLLIIILFATLPAMSQNISRLEYFIDDDPGYGNGVSVPFSGSEIAAADFTVPLSGLDNGLHLLYLRAQNQDGDWSITSVHHILKDVFQAPDAEITELEYFFDTDPGAGNGTSVSVTPGKVVDVAFNADVSGLSNGTHFLFVRSKTNEGVWGKVHQHMIFKGLIQSDASPITKAEYFIDEDPGIGNAIDLPLTPGQEIELAFEADLSSVDPGFHFVNVRSQSENGTWSHAYTQLFLLDVLDSGDEPITYVEYFLDEDPGIGNATEVSITPGKVVELSFKVDLENVEPGFHFVNVRSQSENGTWSHAYTQLFLLDVLDSGDEPITYVEYFLDEDPGIGNATEVSITPGKLVELAFEVDLENVEPGFHFVNVRSQSENGTWSHSFYQMLYVDVLQSSSGTALTYVEYYLDTDPGMGNAIPVEVVPAAVLDLNIMPDISDLAVGFHTFGVRAKDEDEVWSDTHLQTFYIESYSSLNPNLVSLEYFVDEDPGFGSGFSVGIDPPTSVADQDFIVNLGSLAVGEHMLYARAKDEFDNWSIVAIDTFNVELASEFALRFDGQDDYVEAGDFSFPENDFTIEAWINPAEMYDNHEIVYAFGDNGGAQFRLDPDGSLLYGEWGNGNWVYVTTGSSVVQKDTWTHVAVSKEGDLCNIYVNGIQMGVSQFDNNPITHTLQIGGRSTDRFFNGDIDELRIWNVARTPEEIMDNFCANFTGTEEGIYGLWHFDEGPGSPVAYDSGPNGFGAWLFNMEANAGPDCAWIEHSCSLPPAIDLAISEIVSPETLLLASQSGNLEIGALLQNYGIEEFDGEVALGYTLNGSDAVTETASFSILVGETAEYSFPTPIDLSAVSWYELKVFVTVSGDENQSNDTLVMNINSVDLGNSVYAYSAWPGQSGLPVGPVVFDLENPEYLFSLADQSDKSYLNGATWMEGNWWAIANDTLYTIDTITGARTFMGVPGSYISSLAWDPVSGKLYGQSWVSLYEIDPYTFGGIYVGYSGTEGFSALACTPDGILYALNIGDDQIYEINKNTGEATAIGTIGFDAQYEQDMEYDPVSGNIYLTAFNNDVGQGELRTVDPLSGNTTYMGTFRGGMEITGFAIPAKEELAVTDNNALHFDGTADWVDVPDLICPQQFTIECWVNYQGSLVSSYNTLVEFDNDNPWLGINQGKPTIYQVVSSDEQIGEGWHHLAFVVGENFSKVFVDGQETGSADWRPTISSNPGMGIGYQYGDSFWQGSVDELRIWNYARNESEVNATMNQELSGSESGLVAYYNFNQGVAGGDNTGITTLYNSSANKAYNGTLNDFTLTGNTSNFIQAGWQNEGLVADFYAIPEIGKVPLEVEFVDISNGDVLSWLWDFGDGNSSTEENPIHIYTEPGFYTVSLTVADADVSDIETKESYIEVQPLTIYDLQFTTEAGPDNTYPSLYVDETVTVSGLVYAANVNQTGNAFFIISPEGGPWEGIFVYNADIEPSVGDEVVVNGLVQEYSGLTEIHTPVCSIVSSGNVLPLPQIIPGGNLATPASGEPYEGCLVTVQNVTVSQIANQFGVWYVDDGSGECQVDDRCYAYNPSLGEELSFVTGPVYYGFGAYAINPRDAADIGNSSLLADFSATPTSGFVPLTVNFTDLSGGSPVSWLWDFGDGGSSTQQNPVHDYTTFGIYTVSLTVYDGLNENTETKEGYIEVYQTQNGDWALQQVCIENTPEAELMIRAGDIDNLGFGWPDGFDPFTGQSTPEHGFPWTANPEDLGGTDRIMVVSSYDGANVPCWTDGYTSSTVRPENLPESILIDLCQLSQGAINSAALQIFVDDIQPESFCSEYTVKLNGNTFSNLQTIVNHMDQSGPIGRMLTVRIPDELLYLLEGEQLELEIDDFTTGAGDGFAIDFVKLLINEGELTHSGSIAGSVFDASTSMPIEGTEVEASFWETAVTITDGSYSIGEAPAGLVYVECRKSGYQTETTLLNLASGDALNADFWLNPVLMADFSASPLSGQDPLEVQFTDLSSGNPVSWMWDFGDGNTSDLQNPSHLYTNPGFYTVSLTVSDGSTQDDLIKVNYIHVNSPATGNLLAEYFFNNDPGYGNAIPIYGNGGDDVLITFNAPVNHLSDGLHTFYSRSKNENGSWSQTMSRPFLKEYLPEDANPDIAYLEYFFDVDPGFGQGISIAVDALSPLEIAVNLPLETMEYGMHTLYVRSQDANGRWSIVMQRSFIMGNYPADPLKELVKAEYFIDEDPGQGLAEPVLFDPNNGIHNQQFDANLDGYEWGEHMLYVRTMDESGSWSITVAEPFNVEEPPIIAEFTADITQGSVPLSVQFTDETYISEPTEWLWNFGDGNTSTVQNPQHTYADPGTYTVSLTATNDEGTNTEVKENYITVYPPIYSLEYFFDVDPGYGNATGVYAYSSNLGGFNFLAPVDDLDDGYHLLFVRVKDTSSVWTQTMTRSFLKTRLISDPDPNISTVEYFVDDDPGFGQASSIPVSQSPVPVVETLIPLDGYADGLHNIFVRSQDENGRWSETKVRPFLKSYVSGGLANISGLEYFIDDDPGVGNGTSVSVPNPQANIERSFVVNLGAQIPGEHRLFVRAVDERGHWSIVYDQLIEVTATGAVQVIQLPEGWSGISSYIIPDDAELENIFAPVVDEMIILQNFAGMYWPTAGANTLGSWDDHEGYQVKMETAQQVTFSGSMQENLTANLSAGWNYLPVLNSCANEAEELFTQISGNLQIVKEVAGTGVYWPQFGVNTLQEVVPGKAYFVLVDENVSLEFPECGLKQTVPQKFQTLTNPSAGGLIEFDVRRTPIAHSIAFPLENCKDLETGDIITIYNQHGSYCGAAIFTNENLVLTAFGDDPTTPEVDGLVEGEPLQFRVFNPETGKEFPLSVEFEEQMPQDGYFVNHGLSAIKDLQITGLDENQDSEIEISIYPNPSNDLFHIRFGSQSGITNWEVTDMQGSIIARSNDQFNDFTIDISSHPKGIYYLKITKGGLQMVRKLVLQ